MPFSIRNLILSVPRLRTLHVLFLLFALGWITYQNAVMHPFVHDDVFFIQNNTQLKDWSPDTWLTRPVFDGIKEVTVNTYYRPVLEIVYRVIHSVAGVNPHGFHLANILIHIFNSWLVFLLVRQLSGRESAIPLGTAVLFLVHPVQSEAVACISGLSNTVYGFFFLASCCAYFRSRNSVGGMSGIWLTGSAGLFFLSLLAKEQAVMLPFIFIGYELIFRRKQGEKLLSKAVQPAVMVTVLIGYFLFRRAVIGNTAGMGFGWDQELAYRIMAIPKTILTYFGTVFLPIDLHYYRNTDILSSALLPALGLAVLAGLLWVLIRRTDKGPRRSMLFGLFWFFAALGPLLNIIPLVNEYSYILTAEHFIYIPVVGMFFFILTGCAGRMETVSGKSALIFGLVILSCIILTVRQNTFWSSEVKLFERTVRFEPKFARGRMLLGKAYYGEGEYLKGLKQHSMALERMSYYRSRVGDDQEAARIYDSYIKLALWDIIFGFEQMGLHEEAGKYYPELVRLHGPDPAVYNAFGMNRLRLGRIEEAGSYFEKTLELDPDNLSVMNNLAACYAEMGRTERAEFYFRKILEINPQAGSARKNLRKLQNK